MNTNMLKNPRITSINLLYFDGTKHLHFPVSIRFSDDKESYLATELSEKFIKPKKNTVATIILYTNAGVYTGTTKIFDTTLSSFSQITFSVNTPQKWNFKRLNLVVRKKLKLPFCIKFNDGYEIKGITYEMSEEDMTFKVKDDIPDLYTRFTAKLTVELQEGENADKMYADVKFSKTEEDTNFNNGEKFYIFKIVDISSADLILLKNILK